MDYNKLIHDKYVHAESKGHRVHDHQDGHHDHHRGNKVFSLVIWSCISFVVIFGIVMYIINK